MLESLHISNYALIQSIELELGSGLNIITGETGAGKSIMLGALSLLLGERADTRVVRDSSRKSIIEAVFSGAQHAWSGFFAANDDIDDDGQTCVLRREITPSGRTRAFINDTPVTLDKLRALALRLVDIHSQHQNLLLASPEYQLEIIDNMAHNQPLLAEMRQAWEAYAQARRAYREMGARISQQNTEADYMQFQLQQIEQLQLSRGEQAELEQERETLANVTDIKTALARALQNIDIAADIENAADQVQDIAEHVPDGADLAERLGSAAIEIKDIYDTLDDYAQNLSADPERLEAIEERLSDIYSLERKHHVESADELIDIAADLRARLDEIENADERLAELKRRAVQAQKAAMEVAQRLSVRRAEAAAEFAVRLREKAVPLGMKNLAVELRLEPAKLSATGIDTAALLCAFNKNQEPMSISHAASGGEISRLMLSVKALVAEHVQLPTIIFDEIDTGVSGDIAARMGAMMSQIAQQCQVVAITHLPAVAAQGRRHYKVYKQDSDTATHTHIAEIAGEERVRELAQMLFGDATSHEAIAAARALLKN